METQKKGFEKIAKSKNDVYDTTKKSVACHMIIKTFCLSKQFRPVQQSAMEERLRPDNAWASGTTETYPADEELAINVLDKYHLFKSCFIF